jgi:hypothetical protein
MIANMPHAGRADMRATPTELINQGKPADALNRLADSYRVNGDLMECRKCNRGIHVSRMGETMNHAADCPNEDDPNPWSIMSDALRLARGEG